MKPDLSKAGVESSLLRTEVFAPLLLSEAQRDFLLNPLAGAPQETVFATAEEEVAVSLLEEALLDPPASARKLDMRFGETVNAQRALDGLDPRTTVMIRKVPRGLTHEDLETLLDCETPGLTGAVEFLYLPRDVARRSNRGFCFVNFHSPINVGTLASLLQRKQGLPEVLWKCQLYYANIQGSGETLRTLIEQRKQSLAAAVENVRFQCSSS